MFLNITENINNIPEPTDENSHQNDVPSYQSMVIPIFVKLGICKLLNQPCTNLGNWELGSQIPLR